MIENLDQLPINITGHIIKFRNFMIASWPHLDLLMEEHDWDDDGYFIEEWLQSNWELLVERELLGIDYYLTPLWYRYFNKDIEPTYTITTQVAHPILDANTQLPIPQNLWLRIVGFLGPYHRGGLGWYPPFNFAHLVLDNKKKESFIAPIDQLQFYLIKFPLEENNNQLPQ